MYVDLPEAEDVAVRVQQDDLSAGVTAVIETPTEEFILRLPRLHADITGASIRKVKGRAILTLVKAEPIPWWSLLSGGGGGGGMGGEDTDV